MASIKVNSQSAVKACKEAIKHYYTERERLRGEFPKSDIPRDFLVEVSKIEEMAEFSLKFWPGTVSIDQNDFALIGEYLTIPEKNVGDPRFPRCNQCGGNHSSTEYCT